MTIDGNTIVWASAGVVMVAMIVGAVLRFARREVNADVSADKVKLLEKRADELAASLTGFDKRLTLVERDQANHHANDERAFAELRSAIEGLRVAVDEMRHDLLDVLVALRVKERPRDSRDS